MKYYKNNIPKSIKAVQDFRVKVLEHQEQYGIKSAIDAFDVSRSTIYLWQKKYLAEQKLPTALTPKSTKPKRIRRSKPSPLLFEEIIRLRHKYPRMGKSKIKVFLDEYCKQQNIDTISESSIGRIIRRLKNIDKTPKYHRLSYYTRDDSFRTYQKKYTRVKLRRAGYYPKKPGELVQIDCVIKAKNGVRRYIVSAAIDYVSSFAYKSLNSTITSDFMDKLITVAPFTISHIQTDNGSEFSKYFDDKLIELDIIHFWNYAKKPIYNGKIERYNRTSQEDHYNHRQKENKNIQIPPLKAYIYTLKLDQEKSNMLWTHTTT